MALQALLSIRMCSLRMIGSLYPRTTIVLTAIAWSFTGLGTTYADQKPTTTSAHRSDWYGSDSLVTTPQNQTRRPVRHTSQKRLPGRSAPRQAIDPWSAERNDSENPKTHGHMSRAVSQTGIAPVPNGGSSPWGKIAQKIEAVANPAKNVQPALKEVVIQPADTLSTPSIGDGCGTCSSCLSSQTPSCLGITIKSEGLIWWTDGFDTPPLATTSGDGTIDPNNAGVLGHPGTGILFGNSEINNNVRAGGRYTISKPLGSCLAVEASYLRLGRKKDHFSAGGSDGDIVARPFLNIELEEEGSGLTSFPDISSGTLDIKATSAFNLFDLSLQRTVCQGCGFRVNMLAGYRYGELDENLTFRDFNEPLTELAAGTTFTIHDAFDTNNKFHGGQLGLLAEIQQNCWTFEFLMKIALGNSHSTVNINGATLITSPDSTSESFAGGFLALPSNIGQASQDELAFIPEFGLTVSRPLGCHWQMSLGYSFLYWSRVVRPGNQIDRNVDPRQFPPATTPNEPLPASRFQLTDFWAQGLRLGLQRTW